MRARILMLAEDDRYREPLRVAQQALSAVAVAFGHSFAMREDVLQNRRSLDEDTALLIGGRDALHAAALGMGFSYGERYYAERDWDLGLSRMRDGRTPAGAVVFPLSPDPGRVARACSAACAMARKGGGELLFIPPHGSEALWQGAMSRASLYASVPQPEPLRLEDALAMALTGLGERHITVADAETAGLMDTVLSHAGGMDTLAYTAYARDEGRVFAAPVPYGRRKPGLFSVLYAAAALLDDGLRLGGEGGCLRAALDNVLHSGWRARDMKAGERTVPDEEILSLVKEQVALAGELFDRLQQPGTGEG